MIKPQLALAAALLLHTLPTQGQTSGSQPDECAPAAVIITHEPGEELFVGVIHPTAALFEDYMDIDKIVAEHRNYRHELEKSGAKVFTVRDILLEGTTDKSGAPIEGEALNSLRMLASEFLTFDCSRLDSEAARGQEEYRRRVLRSATPEDLVSIIMLQPTVQLLPTQYNTKLAAEYEQSPVMNLFYMRDQMITTAKGCVVGRMHSPQREKECDIAAFCLAKIGIAPIHRIVGEGAYLEGGDFYPFGNRAFIGCGMRTTQAAIDQLMEHDLLGCDSLVVVKDRLFSQAEMHLDTYFNIIDRDLATLSTARMTSDPASPNLLLADVYVRSNDGGYQLAAGDVPFVEMLRRELGMNIIPIAPEDSERLANNFLTVGPRHIMAVGGQSETFRKALQEHGVKVCWLPLENLRKGYGAAHCMTQVVVRKQK